MERRKTSKVEKNPLFEKFHMKDEVVSFTQSKNI